MKLRNIARRGSSAVLFLVLGSTYVVADPAAGNPYTQNPTPEERAQTQRLNAESAREAATPPQTPPEERALYEARQSQYRQNMESYQAQRDRYLARKERYLDRRAEYEDGRSHPAAWWRAHFERASRDGFDGVSRAELIDLRVVREDGAPVGHVRDARRDGSGRLAAVLIRLRDGGTAWVPARTLRYDPGEEIVFTDLGMGELNALARNS
jgi:hypothetical protein